MYDNFPAVCFSKNIKTCQLNVFRTIKKYSIKCIYFFSIVFIFFIIYQVTFQVESTFIWLNILRYNNRNVYSYDEIIQMHVSDSFRFFS